MNEYDDGDNLVRVTRNYTTAGAQNYLGLYNQITTYAYSAAGLWGQSRRAWMTDTQGLVTRSEYDAAGRLVRSTRNYTTTTEQNHLNTYNLVTAYGYDEVGNQEYVTDTLGHVTYTEYDELDRVERTWQNYTTTTTAQNYLNTYNLLTEYGYDTVGNQVLVTDTLGSVAYTEYDALNRVVRTQDAGGKITRYGYDEVGSQVLVTDTLGSVTYTAYDPPQPARDCDDALRGWCLRPGTP